MLVQHSYEALALAFAMDALDASRVVTLHDALPAGAPAPYIEPLRLEAARIVCAWVDAYGPFPTLH